ncbi:MAG: acyl-CoA thioesterase [Pirellulaceae bacterium]|nr:acyl-CoA thioesterase [Pirellulaceae bacterium]
MSTLPTERYLAVKVVMMPRDTNAVGTIFGGVLLSYIDQAGAVGAIAEVRKQGWQAPALVTVAMNGVEFHVPVEVGEVVSFWTRVTRIGRTSITTHVSVEAEREHGPTKLTEAEVVYVAIDKESPVRKTLEIRRESAP